MNIVKELVEGLSSMLRLNSEQQVFFQKNKKRDAKISNGTVNLLV